MRHGSLKTDLSVLAIVLLVIAVSLVFPDTMKSIRYYFLGLSMLLIGIPHGAIDHIISSRLFNLRGKLSDQLKFYIPYLLLMLAMALIWIVSGLAGFIIFALITMYHFGQADLEHLKMPGGNRWLLTISRGLMILSLIIFVNISYTFPIIQQATGLDIFNSEWLLKNSALLGTFLAIQHPILLLITMHQFRTEQEYFWWYPVLDSLVILILFSSSDPIVGFSVYFALWHSMGHFLEMKKFFKDIGESLSLWKFYKLAAPFTLISLVGLALIYLLNEALGMEEQMLTLLFILISVLTLPHVLVVQKMLNTKI